MPNDLSVKEPIVKSDTDFKFDGRRIKWRLDLDIDVSRAFDKLRNALEQSKKERT